MDWSGWCPKQCKLHGVIRVVEVMCGLVGTVKLAKKKKNVLWTSV